MKKIRISLILIFILFIALTCNVNAETCEQITVTTPQYEDIDVSITLPAGVSSTDKLSTFIKISNINNYYYFYLTVIIFSDDTTTVTLLDNGSSTNCYIYTDGTFDYYYSSSRFSSLSSISGYVFDLSSSPSTGTGETGLGSDNLSACYIAASTVDIYDYNDTDTLVFQVPSSTVTLWTAETIQAVPEMMTEALKVIIPVGLVLLSIGLLIYLIRLVISRLQ